MVKFVIAMALAVFLLVRAIYVDGADWTIVSPEKIKKLVEFGKSAKPGNGKGRTPLMDAALSDSDPAAVAAFLKAGAEVNVWDADGRTALMEAARGNSNPEVVEMLIRAGANVNACDRIGLTPLMLAGYNRNPAVADALIRAGASKRCPSLKEQTPALEIFDRFEPAEKHSGKGGLVKIYINPEVTIVSEDGQTVSFAPENPQNGESAAYPNE